MPPTGIPARGARDPLNQLRSWFSVTPSGSRTIERLVRLGAVVVDALIAPARR